MRDGSTEPVFAVDEEGVCSQQGQPEAAVLDDLLGEIESYNAQRVVEARKDVLEGRRSCLYYWMCAFGMDERGLAGRAGLWAWRVRRHLRPEVFQALPPRLMNRYAQSLGITLAELRSLPEREPT